MASPCCQGHSRAKGSTKDWSEKSRSTAWCVYSCAVANRPQVIVVENVPEFRTWSEDADDGYVFRAWRDLISRISPGYHYSDIVVDAADLGVPQHRERLFMVFTRKDVAGPVQFEIPRRAHVPAASILGSGGRWSKVSDKAATTRGFVERTTQRRYDVGTPFLVPYFSKTLRTGLGRGLDRPVGTITTKARYAVVDDSHQWLRMFSVDEYRRAMGFCDDYVLPASQEAAVRQLGNAVCPPVAAWVLGQVQGHLGRRAA
jgi:DNA (cytosine-5)-methyltransferase 1